MTSFKRLLGVAVLSGVFLLGGLTVFAQSEQSVDAKKRPPAAKGRARLDQDMPERRLNLMTRNLGLTKEQQKKIKPILQDEAAQLDALRGDDSYNRDERRAKLQNLNESTYEKIRPILTPDQQQKHETAKQIIKDNRSRQRDTKANPRMTDNDPVSRLARLTQDLGLSNEQQEKIKPILQEEFVQLEKLPGNDTLNREQRRAKLQKLNEETSEKIQPLLTPEQQIKHAEIRKKISDRRSLKKSKESDPDPAKQ